MDPVPAEDRQPEPRENAVHASTPRWMMLPWLGLLGLVVAAAVILLGSRGVESAGDPGDDSPEAGFARDMSTHHRQAVEMAFLILERSDDPAVKLLATDIITTQQHQVGQMYAWLALWGLPQAGLEPPMAWTGHPSDAPMPGMASQEELRHLASLRGVEADREFLRLMIIHHQGGAPMAEAIVERSDNQVVTRLARAIVNSQTAEIETMEAMLAAKGGAPVAAATPAPAHDVHGG